jgi:hypothetical protein
MQRQVIITCISTTAQLGSSWTTKMRIVKLSNDGGLKVQLDRDTASPHKAQLLVPCNDFIDNTLDHVRVDYTVSAVYTPAWSGDACCEPTVIRMTAEGANEEVGNGFGTRCQHFGEDTVCGHLCNCGVIGVDQSWTSGSMDCSLIGSPTVFCWRHGWVYCCPDAPTVVCASSVDIFNTEFVGGNGVTIINFIRPLAFLHFFHDFDTGDYFVLPVGYVADRYGFGSTYCYANTTTGHTAASPLMMAVCAFDYCGLAERIVLGPHILGKSFDIDVSLDVPTNASTTCRGGTLDGYNTFGNGSCCTRACHISFSWHLLFKHGPPL